MAQSSETVQTSLQGHQQKPDRWLDAEFNSVVRNVLWILSNHPETRNKDNLLIPLYWRIFDSLEINVTELSQKATSPELIRRARQWIQSPTGKAEFLPTDPKVAAARARRERGFRHRFGKKKPGDTTLEGT
jgi:hypothetical protein